MAADRLRDHPRIRFLFVGNGFHEPAVERAVVAGRAVLRLPPQPRPVMRRRFARADVSLVGFRPLPALDAASPAKLYDSLGAGTPVVVMNSGWTRRLVEAEGCGWHVVGPDPERLAALLTRLAADPAAVHAAGERGRAHAERHFDRRRLAAQFEAVVVGAAERGRTNSPIPTA